MPEGPTLIAGRYELEHLLGRGGMSEVYRATDTELGRRVAIKLLAPDADTARFEREARAVASLAHPNVTQLYDYGEDDGRPYMVLEYVPGGTLEERLADAKRKPLPDAETTAIASGIASGLAHAHARGVVHRDLKPANVLFDEEGRPKLADFGIARMAAGEGTLTEAGTVLGTAAYISPEQASGASASTASDVYSFGVMLYRMLTGRLPFESSDPMELIRMNRDDPPPPVTAFRDDPPGRLEAAVAAALEKDPADRPQDGAALLAALGVTAGTTLLTPATAAAGDATRVLPVAGPAAAPTTVTPAAAPPPLPPEPPRSRWPLAGAILVVLLLAGGALAYAVTRSPTRHTDLGTQTLPQISLAKARHRTTATTQATPSTAAPTTSTTQATTTMAPTTSRRTTTQASTTVAPPPTTVAPPPTTVAPPPTTTTTVVTTDTTAVTTTTP